MDTFSVFHQNFREGVHLTVNESDTMIKVHNPKSYSLITGTILFLLGFLGFAFRNNFDLPDRYLLISLALGFWGIVVGVGKGNDKN